MRLGSSGHEAYLALDAGEINGNSAQHLPGNTLTGGVVGLRGTYRKLQYDAFAGAPLYQPAGFKTLDTTAGFSVTLSY